MENGLYITWALAVLSMRARGEEHHRTKRERVSFGALGAFYIMIKGRTYAVAPRPRKESR